MKNKLIVLLSSLFFGIVLGIWRLYLLGKFVDSENGFFIREYRIQGLLIAVIILVLILFYFILSRKTKEYPISPRKGSKTISVFGFLLGIVCLIVIIDKFKKIKISSVDLLLLFLLFFFSFYFILLSLSQLRIFKISSKYAIIPLFYFVAELASCFLKSFGIVGSQQTYLEILCYVLFVLYFLVFSRYLAKSKFKKVRKHFLWLSLSASTVSIAYGLSDLLCFVLYPDFASARGLNVFDTSLVLFLGIYIFAFACASFLKKKVYRKYTDGSYENPKICEKDKLVWDSLKNEKK